MQCEQQTIFGFTQRHLTTIAFNQHDFKGFYGPILELSFRFKWNTGLPTNLTTNVTLTFWIRIIFISNIKKKLIKYIKKKKKHNKIPLFNCGTLTNYICLKWGREKQILSSPIPTLCYSTDQCKLTKIQYENCFNFNFDVSKIRKNMPIRPSPSANTALLFLISVLPDYSVYTQCIMQFFMHFNGLVIKIQYYIIMQHWGAILLLHNYLFFLSMLEKLYFNPEQMNAKCEI